MEIIVDNIKELSNVCNSLSSMLGDEKVIAIYGDMGAGKTTFVKKYIEHLGGGEEDISSPTFSLVNECGLKDGKVAYHFDFYRIEDEDEAYDIGFEDYIYSGNLCLIEWPQKIQNLLPENYVMVHIKEQNGQRIFSIKKV